MIGEVQLSFFVFSEGGDIAPGLEDTIPLPCVTIAAQPPDPSATVVAEHVGAVQRGYSRTTIYESAGDGATFGIIASTTAPFCRSCDRGRLTADGHWYQCLYAREGLDLKSLLRGGAGAEQVRETIRAAWMARSDRGAEERLAARDDRGPLFDSQALKRDPHLEMHTRGG